MILDSDLGALRTKELEQLSQVHLGTALRIRRHYPCHELTLSLRRKANPMSQGHPLREPRQEFVGRLGRIKISVDPGNLRFECAPAGPKKYFLKYREQLAQVFRRVVYPRQVAQQGSRGIRSHFPTPLSGW